MLITPSPHLMVHHRIRSDPRGPRHFVVCSSDGGLPSGGARAYCFAIRFYAHIASLPTRQSAIYVPEGTVLSEAFPTYRIVWCMASRSPASCSARRCPRPASPPGRAHGLCVVVVVDAGCVGPSFGGAQSSRVSSVYPSESYLSAWITNLPPKAPKSTKGMWEMLASCRAGTDVVVEDVLPRSGSSSGSRSRCERLLQLCSQPGPSIEGYVNAQHGESLL